MLMRCRIKVPLLKEERDLTAAAIPADVVADRKNVYACAPFLLVLLSLSLSLCVCCG
jgi:hypothetical protein